MAPILPQGTPPALVLDPKTPTLVPAVPRDSLLEGTEPHWITYQIGRNEFPACCCNCLLPIASESGKDLPVDSALKLKIPVCDSCAGQIKRRAWLTGLVLFGTMMAGGLGVLLALRLDSVLFWLLFGG